MNLDTRRILIDTGPLVALVDRNDPYHAACVKQARELGEPNYTCWPVITEACYLLRSRPDLVQRLLEACHEGVYQILSLGANDIPEIGGTLAKYGDQRIDLADACLVHLAEREGINTVFTVDRRHFELFRNTAGLPLELLPG